MKNLKYFNFERNKYFYGKLLNVEDFETEQRYMNDKRRILNRLVHGMGVVCGMNVVGVDEETVSVEMGLALDFAGREIVVEKPVLKKLSTIDGFEDYEDDDEVNNRMYLYIEYREVEKEGVHNIAAGGRDSSKQEYNRIQEGYHLYLSSQEPEEKFLTRSLYEDVKTVYAANGMKIVQTVPKYIESEKEFELTIQVENISQQKPISFTYRLEMNGVEPADNLQSEVSFNEADYPKSEVYTIIKKFRALGVKRIRGSLKPEEGSFLLRLGGEEWKPELTGGSSFIITENGIEQEITEQYYKNAMEEIVRTTTMQGICLAKLSVVRAEKTYLINHVEPMPFGQYVFANPLAQAIDSVDGKKQSEEIMGSLTSRKKIEKGEQQMTACGDAVVNLGLGGLKGQKFFSGDIVHGLGLGLVYLNLGVSSDMSDTGRVVYGQQDIFEQREHRAPVRLAARLDVTKGSFQIGVECLDDTTEQQLKIHWMAVKDPRKKAETEKLTMQIKPDMKNVTVRESFYLEALISGISDSRIFWSVKEKEGGSIDENGMYTAPNQPGVYEVVAKSMDNPELMASTYVVVRDKS